MLELINSLWPMFIGFITLVSVITNVYENPSIRRKG